MNVFGKLGSVVRSDVRDLCLLGGGLWTLKGDARDKLVG